MTRYMTPANRAKWLVVATVIATLTCGCSITDKATPSTDPESWAQPPAETGSTLKTDPNLVAPGQTIPPPGLGVDL